MNREAQMIAYLARRLKPVKVYARVPPDRPKTFITVERTGGVDDRFLDRPVFAIQAWAESPYMAATLADEIRAVLPDIVGEAGVSGWHGATMYSWPDPESKHARYQIITEITTYSLPASN